MLKKAERGSVKGGGPNKYFLHPRDQPNPIITPSRVFVEINYLGTRSVGDLAHQGYRNVPRQRTSRLSILTQDESNRRDDHKELAFAVYRMMVSSTSGTRYSPTVEVSQSC